MVKNYKSQFVAVIIFVVCMAFAWLYPLKSVNVTLLMEFSGAEDGASAELLIDRGSWILVQQISCITQSIRIIRSAGF